MIGNGKSILWTMIFTWVLLVPTGAKAVVFINELHTNPDVETELVEFVELHNNGTGDVDLSGWHFSEGIFYTFAQGTVLPAGGFAVVAQDLNELYAKWGILRANLPTVLVLGPYAGKLSSDGEKIVLSDAAGATVDAVEYKSGFPWPTVGEPVPANQPGTGHSIQLLGPHFDNDLGGSWRSAAPTPGFPNIDVLTDNIPPCIRQVDHSPAQPKSGEPVAITAKITDLEGVQTVLLSYQVVAPGRYIALDDPQYENDWTTVAMHDDGLDGDAEGQDDIYTALIPASAQVHRRLVRYRIYAMDGSRKSVTVPYDDDPQPNFAYFVYDGVPAWRGAVQPGVKQEIVFPSFVMTSLPVYHLISKKSDVEECTWLSKYGGSDYRWQGTLVYDGHVYDHIRYRARGGVWRYAMGKNMWKFDFNRGHGFLARDDYGNKHDTKWDKLNFSACIQQGSFGQRGEQGMFEALSFRLFNMAGCPASKTNYLHFRIIDELYEDGARNAAHPPLTTSGTQFDGDFWGLYMTIEQMDGRFLDEHDLPDGNLFKIDNSNHETNNQGPTQPSNQSDLNAFLNQVSGASESWWQANTNLDAYYAYYAIYQAVHHGDITGKNWFLYHHPETDRWWQLPWDLDLTWTTYYGSNDPSDPWSRAGLLNRPTLSTQNKNRLREINDLLWNPDQTGQLIDEYAAIIDDPAGGLSMVDADRAMWDYHWAVGNGAYPTYLNQQASFKAGQGKFYAAAAGTPQGRTFEGMVQVMKDYVAARAGYLAGKASDAAIPATPTITSLAAEGFPVNTLTFLTSPFSDPQGAGTFAALEWRLAEVEPGAVVTVPPQNEGTVLLTEQSRWKYFKGTQEPASSPVDWRDTRFDDAQWLSGTTPIGYGETFIATNLGDMRGSYSTFYVRREFNVADPETLGTVRVEAMFDDGIKVWINGSLVASNNVSSGELPHTATTDNRSENHDFTAIATVEASQYLVAGTNVVTAQLVNQSLGDSSDCFFDLRLSAEPEDATAESPAIGPTNYTRQPRKYEIDPVWESGELTEFSDNITIPASLVRPGRTYRVRCRMADTSGRWSHWSAPIQFVAGEPLAVGIVADLRITEVMYNPVAVADDDGDECEFIELKNIGDETLDLGTVSLVEGVTFDFANGAVTTVGPGQFVLVVRNRDAFLARYGMALADLIVGEYAGKLANDGETVRLDDFWNGTIVEFTYSDGRGWPLAADGAGHSLVPVASAILEQPTGSLRYGGNWRASAYLGGSPGADDPDLAATVVINEFLAGGGDDWIELYNVTNASVDLSDFYLSDDADNLAKWAVAAPAIAAGDFLTFEESGDDLGFGLSRSGEQLFLSYLSGTAEDRIVDSVRFKAQEEGVSLGRYPDGAPWWHRAAPTRDTANVTPIADVVIDEVMYHPVDGNDEYVELYNPTDTALELAGPAGPWRLGGAVEYTFASGQSLPPGGRLVVVNFSPLADFDRLGEFVLAYADELLVPGVDIVGPWQGSLNSSGERLALEKPLATGEPNDTAWAIVDEVIYSDLAPWPTSADGQGDALQRVISDATASGNDPANWQAAPPTPGPGPGLN